jgi:hypothetical protein
MHDFWRISLAIPPSRSRSVRLCYKNARSVTSGLRGRIGATVQPGAAMTVQGDEPGRSRSGFSIGVRSRPDAANEVQFVRCPRGAVGVDEGHADKARNRLAVCSIRAIPQRRHGARSKPPWTPTLRVYQGSLHESALSVRHPGRSMNGLRAGMSAPSLMAAARVAAGVTSLTCQEPTFTGPLPNRRSRPRPCEKTIAANHWAIYCRCARLRHCEDFGCTILRAIGLLVFITVVTFHTASTLCGHSCQRPSPGAEAH